MTESLADGAKILRGAGFETDFANVEERSMVVFEGATVLGFMLAYPTVDQLLANWRTDSQAAVRRYQFGLRRADKKAWNVYLILLAENSADRLGAAALAAIEEDLDGTRKIARGNAGSPIGLRAALTPLLPLQAPPMLETVDIADEIRQRTTELPSRSVDAFLSSAEDVVVLQILGGTS